MQAAAGSPSLIGRRAELDEVDSALDRAERLPVALLLEGEPGIGKTTIWRAAIDRALARGCRVLVARPAEPERELSFSVLADLFEHESLGRLPANLAEALQRALAGAEIDARSGTHAVARAGLQLLRGLAAEAQVVLAIDDVQWIDQPSSRALSFALRRLEREPVTVIASIRSRPGGGPPECLGGVEPVRLRVEPLSLAAIQRLLRLRLELSPPRPTLLRLYEVSGGNPFYALELARTLPPRVAPVEALPVPATLAELPSQRILRLPRRTRVALLAASASSAPTARLLAEAIPGLTRDDLEPAERAGILELEHNALRFTHPLLASTVYGAAPPAERRRVHLRLAEVADGDEERARHLALGSHEPDREVAEALDGAAGAASARGAPESAAALLEHAVRLTPESEPEARSRRTIEAARRWQEAGDTGRARELLEPLEDTVPPGPGRAEVLLRLAEIADDYGRGISRCEQALAEAADDLRLQVSLERQLVELWSNAGDQERAVDHGARAVELAERLGDPALVAAGLGDMSMQELFRRGVVRLDLLERAVEIEREMELVGYDAPSTRLGLALLWSDEPDRAAPLLEEQVRACAERGLEDDRLALLFHLGEAELRAGRVERAERLSREVSDGASQVALDQLDAYAAGLEAMVAFRHGRLADVRGPALRARARAEALGDGFVIAGADLYLGAAELAAGDADAALPRLDPLPAMFEAMGFRNLGAWFTELHSQRAEALVALGRLDEAEEAAVELEHHARDLDRPLAIGLALRVRAQAAAARGDLDGALALVGDALGQLERRPLPFELGTTLLFAGSLERRARRKARARELLTRSRELLEAAGAGLWAERARAELGRIGGRPPAPSELTATEEEVVRLVVTGATNREVAQTLFMSVKTVEAHLGHVYRKLGVHSRRELARLAAGKAASTQAQS